MKKQNGAALIIAIVLTTLITLVFVISIQGVNLDVRQVSNNAIEAVVQQETNNEILQIIRFYDDASNYSDLIALEVENTVHPITTQSTNQEAALNSTLIYNGERVCTDTNIQIGASSACPAFELTTVGSIRSTTSNQSVGIHGIRPDIQTVGAEPSP